jgi:hypothetical protein
MKIPIVIVTYQGERYLEGLTGRLEFEGLDHPVISHSP